MTALVQVAQAIVGVVLLALLWTVGAAAEVVLVLLLAWDVLALVHLTCWFHRAHRERFAGGSPARLPLARLRYVALLIASAAGLTSGLLVVVLDADEPAGPVGAVQTCAAVTAALAWVMLHAGYATHYAGLCHRHGGGLSFPDTVAPNHLDFGYFAFTIGATFATSDVEVRSRVLRHAVLWHSMLSFFYNAAVIGIAIGFLTGK